MERVTIEPKFFRPTVNNESNLQKKNIQPAEVCQYFVNNNFSISFPLYVILKPTALYRQKFDIEFTNPNF